MRQFLDLYSYNLVLYSDFRSIVYHRYKSYVTYIDSLIGNLQNRFQPWPQWLLHCERTFNFLNDLEESDRKLSFETLLGMPSGTVTLLSDEISRLKTEYQTMLVNVQEIVHLKCEKEALRIEGVWYSLFTEERF